MINFSPAMRAAIAKMDDTEKKVFLQQVQDDLGLAFNTFGNLIRVNSIDISFDDNGITPGSGTDIDFGVGEIYRALRIQRAITCAVGAPGYNVLQIEREQEGF